MSVFPFRFSAVLVVVSLAFCCFGQKTTLSNQGEHLSYRDSETELSALERTGRDTWYFWTAGGEKMWRELSKRTKGTTDLLLYVADSKNGSRFRDLGVITEPGCQPATKPDEYGFGFDDCESEGASDIPGLPSGILGLRKFDNEHFEADHWSLEKYRADPTSIEPPYLIGMACGFCHNAFNPLHPPMDVEHPKWENIAPALGNQYFEEGKLFSSRMTPSDFRWHVANRQPAGTSDTSRVATDHIFNPNAINSIFGLNYRPFHTERMKDGSSLPVHHILKDGADSTGLARASLRVYVNIGMCSEIFFGSIDPVEGIGAQKPFPIEEARKNCPKWIPTENRMAAVEAFLKTIEPMHLEDAPGGKSYVKNDSEVLRRGKIAFADNCARCHTSKPLPSDLTPGSAAAKEWYREYVLAADFLSDNFLSDDKRYPVTEIGTNFARAAATNAMRGHVWDNFASETYKDLPSVGQIRDLYNPLDPSRPISYTLPAGGSGYYRTPSLISVWATAPYFHNNSLGVYVKDPSVCGRMTAFEDGMEKLLWPEKRLGAQSIMRTSTPSKYDSRDGSQLEIPAGIPVKLIANLDPNKLKTLGRDANWFVRLLSRLFGGKLLWNTFLAQSLAPDFIEDRGHTFGADLSNDDKRALIEFMKTF